MGKRKAKTAMELRLLKELERSKAECRKAQRHLVDAENELTLCRVKLEQQTKVYEASTASQIVEAHRERDRERSKNALGAAILALVNICGWDPEIGAKTGRHEP